MGSFKALSPLKSKFLDPPLACTYTYIQIAKLILIYNRLLIGSDQSNKNFISKRRCPFFKMM